MQVPFVAGFARRATGAAWFSLKSDEIPARWIQKRRPGHVGACFVHSTRCERALAPPRAPNVDKSRPDRSRRARQSENPYQLVPDKLKRARPAGRTLFSSKSDDPGARRFQKRRGGHVSARSVPPGARERALGARRAPIGDNSAPGRARPDPRAPIAPGRPHAPIAPASGADRVRAGRARIWHRREYGPVRARVAPGR